MCVCVGGGGGGVMGKGLTMRKGGCDGEGVAVGKGEWRSRWRGEGGCGREWGSEH